MSFLSAYGQTQVVDLCAQSISLDVSRSLNSLRKETIKKEGNQSAECTQLYTRISLHSMD